MWSRETTEFCLKLKKRVFVEIGARGVIKNNMSPWARTQKGTSYQGYKKFKAVGAQFGWTFFREKISSRKNLTRISVYDCISSLKSGTGSLSFFSFLVECNGSCNLYVFSTMRDFVSLFEPKKFHWAISLKKINLSSDYFYWASGG